MAGYWNMPPSYQPAGTIVWVQGVAGAEAYPIAPNGKLMLMDAQNSVLYIKTADATGRPYPLVTYDLVERVQTQADESNTLPIIDYDRIREIVADEVKKQMFVKKQKKEAEL